MKENIKLKRKSTIGNSKSLGHIMREVGLEIFSSMEELLKETMSKKLNKFL